ncbi:MAG: RNA polymerase subunit sigma-24 [Verrucomicrobiales bacterium]|nr:RNA polymerase subunit sigma-24 [Verrucomicrobiales bacterium]MBL68626.1 RNA polymerase subunit sigma-24 [Verrucomicrobiales bacterium]|tara:strand:- start:9337 stop:9996 length:660 start_codon:yes stop_codon:yes gene_type:complete
MQLIAHAHEESTGSSEPLTDADLVARVRAGDNEVFALLVERHQQQVFAILSRYERDRHRVEDLAQDTFLKAWKGLEQYRASAPFQHWISRIAVNVALDHIRRATRRIRETGFDDLGDAPLDWLRSENSERDVEKAEACELLGYLLAQLSEDDRKVITLQSIEGWSVDDISRLTGWSSVSVRVRAHRARGRLRNALRAMLAEEQRRTLTVQPLEMFPQAA